MKVNLRVYGHLKVIVGERESEIEIPGGTRVAGLPPILKSHFGEAFYMAVYTDPPFSGMRVLIGGRDLFSFDGLETVLKPGDTITILPPVAGGQE